MNNKEYMFFADCFILRLTEAVFKRWNLSYYGFFAMLFVVRYSRKSLAHSTFVVQAFLLARICSEHVVFWRFRCSSFHRFCFLSKNNRSKDARDLSCLFWSRSPITGSFLKILIFSWQTPAIMKTPNGSATKWKTIWIHEAPGFSFVQATIWGLSVFPYSACAFTKNWMMTMFITKNPW